MSPPATGGERRVPAVPPTSPAPSLPADLRLPGWILVCLFRVEPGRGAPLALG